MIRELTSDEFNDFNDEFQSSSVYQTVEYARVMQNQNFETLTLGFVDNGEILAATIILVEKTLGFKYGYAPRGFLIDWNNKELLEMFTSEIKKFLSKREIMAIKLNPLVLRSTYNPENKKKQFNGDHDIILKNLKKLGYEHLGFNNQFEALKPRFESITDISINYEEIFLSFKKDLRNKIRSSENKAIKIIKGSESKLEYLHLYTKGEYSRDLNYFKDLYNNFGNKIDFFYAKIDTSLYLNKAKEKLEHYELLSSKINLELESSSKKREKIIEKKIDTDLKLYKAKQDLQKAINLFNKHKDGLILASALFIKNKGEVLLLIDGYDKEYREFNAKHLLIWRTIEYYHNLGFNKLNLGGITNINVKDEYDGLNQFKLAFNGVAYEYIGDFELVINSKLYFMYRHARPIADILKI